MLLKPFSWNWHCHFPYWVPGTITAAGKVLLSTKNYRVTKELASVISKHKPLSRKKLHLSLCIHRIISQWGLISCCSCCTQRSLSLPLPQKQTKSWHPRRAGRTVIHFMQCLHQLVMQHCQHPNIKLNLKKSGDWHKAISLRSLSSILCWWTL